LEGLRTCKRTLGCTPAAMDEKASWGSRRQGSRAPMQKGPTRRILSPQNCTPRHTLEIKLKLGLFLVTKRRGEPEPSAHMCDHCRGTPQILGTANQLMTHGGRLLEGQRTPVGSGCVRSPMC
ncbi:hypothetical protein KC19_5G097100, partial [Ceratodon purpureus]